MENHDDLFTGDQDEGAPSRFADDEFFQALASARRRRVLAYLVSQHQCSVAELASVLCGWKTETSPMVGADEEHRIRVDLYHRHLPHLDDAGLVSYDQTTQQVTATSLTQPVATLISRSIQAESA